MKIYTVIVQAGLSEKQVINNYHVNSGIRRINGSNIFYVNYRGRGCFFYGEAILLNGSHVIPCENHH